LVHNSVKRLADQAMVSVNTRGLEEAVDDADREYNIPSKFFILLVTEQCLHHLDTGSTFNRRSTAEVKAAAERHNSAW